MWGVVNEIIYMDNDYRNTSIVGVSVIIIHTCILHITLCYLCMENDVQLLCGLYIIYSIIQKAS